MTYAAALRSFILVSACVTVNSAAAEVYICGYSASTARGSPGIDVSITVTGSNAVASAHRVARDTPMVRFKVVQNNRENLVMARTFFVDERTEAAAVFGIDKRTGYLFHCVNLDGAPGTPMWVGNCLISAEHPRFHRSERNSSRAFSVS